MLGAYNEGLEECPDNKFLEKGADYASDMIEKYPAPKPSPPKKKKEKVKPPEMSQ